MYKSEAPHGKKDNNRPHDGAAVMDIVSSPARKLVGSYFTDRKGAGTMVLDKHSETLTRNFGDAEQLIYKP